MVFANFFRTTSILIFLAGISLSSVHADVINVNNSEVVELLEEGVPIVDVRRPEEWQKTGVIDDSHLITFFKSDGSFDAAEWQRSLDEIVNSKQPVILICHSGGRTSLIARWLSAEIGHEKVYNVEKGTPQIEGRADEFRLSIYR